MCVIIPIDHAPCTHTVALWQHCANAPRSVFGHKPCSHIRQHGRPILTRKLCHNCGGPRFFARRGGLAARGSGNPMLDEVMEQKEEHGDQYDSGYQSDLIPEVDEEAEHDDSLLSPRQSAASLRWKREFSSQRSSNTPRSSGQKSNWRPNLKRDLSESSSSVSSDFSSRRTSIVSTVSKPDTTNTHSFQARLSYNSVKRLAQSLTPILRNPSPRRKVSTLLHPSPPLESSESSRRASVVSFQDITPPVTPPEHHQTPTRKGSTLLHPSSPQIEPVSVLSKETSFPFAFSLPRPMAELPTSAPIDTSTPPQESFPRKNSTLLHPSSPSDEDDAPYTARTIISLPPTPQTTPTLGSFKRSTSALSSSSNDDDWEEPLHSSHSDAEYDSDDDQSVAAFAPHRSSVRVARLGQTARASRISFHGNQLRILQDWN